MLQKCCGICGQKKTTKQLRKITENIYKMIKATNGYEDYDINNNKYPKVICNQHYNALQERTNHVNTLCKTKCQTRRIKTISSYSTRCSIPAPRDSGGSPGLV